VGSFAGWVLESISVGWRYVFCFLFDVKSWWLMFSLDELHACIRDLLHFHFHFHFPARASSLAWLSANRLISLFGAELGILFLLLSYKYTYLFYPGYFFFKSKPSRIIILSSHVSRTKTRTNETQLTMDNLFNKGKEMLSKSGNSSTGTGTQQPAQNTGNAGQEDYVDKGAFASALLSYSFLFVSSLSACTLHLKQRD